MINALLWLPLAVGFVGFFLPKRLVGWWATAGAVATLAIGVIMAFGFDNGVAGLQDTVNTTWISGLGVNYSLGIDGLNLFLVLLTALLWVGGIAFAAFREQERPQLFFFLMLAAETATLGSFLSQDLLLFVLFFDLMLVPFYFLVGQWGGPDRVAATFKLVVYTLVGSLLMLAAAVATGVLAPGAEVTFSIQRLAAEQLGDGPQRWIFVAFALAFLIKMPAFPFHGWMPDGYRNMPLPVLAVFSAVLSKVAAYGFLRIVLPIFPDATQDFQLIMLLLALASVLYGSAQAFTQTNARLILGYSSMAQLGFITLGIFALGEAAGAQGALLQMVQHGLVVAPLFFIIALLHERTGSDDIRDMGGVAFRAPVLSTLFLIVALATLAMPGSANFAGEFLILLGLFNAKLVIAIIAFTGVAMASVYMLRMFIRAMHNRVGEKTRSFDLSLADGLVLVPLVAVIIAFAVYPQQALDSSQASVERVVGAAAPESVAQREVTP